MDTKWAVTQNDLLTHGVEYSTSFCYYIYKLSLKESCLNIYYSIAVLEIELSSSVYVSEEGDSFVTITITKSAVTTTDVDVIILLRDESALGGFAMNGLHV